MELLKKRSVAVAITLATVLLSTIYLVMLDSGVGKQLNHADEETNQEPEYEWVYDDVEDTQLLEEDSEEVPNKGFSQSLEDNNISQEEFVLTMREELKSLAENYEGEVTIIPNVHSAIAPNLNAFIPAPSTIYTTPASENGFGDTYMFVEGQVESWNQDGDWTTFIISNNTGSLFLTIAEPLLDKAVADYIDMLPVGTYVRVYLQYLGFSEVLGYGGGFAIGLSIYE